MGIGSKVVGALKGGVERLESTQKKLEPYEKRVYEAAKEAAVKGERALERGVKTEMKAFPGQVKRAKKLARKTGQFVAKEVGEGVALEKKMWPTQKKVAKKGIEFLQKGFEEAYGKGGMFGGATDTLGRGISEMGDERGEDDERPVRRMRRVKQARQPQYEEGPRNYMDEYMAQYEDDFWNAAEETRGENGEVPRRKFKKEAKTPVERYLEKYEAKMARKGL